MNEPLPSFARRHTRFDVTCPGCDRRISGLSEDARRERMLRHIRNCRGLAFGKSEQCVPAPEGM